MTIRTRKLLGGLAMMVFVLIYALCAMALAQAHTIRDAGKIVQALVYAVLGLAWIVPLMPLVRWMERKPSRFTQGNGKSR